MTGSSAVPPARQRDASPLGSAGLRKTEEPARFGKLIGRSAAMRQVFALLRRAAKTDACVLVQGEAGTGKEACADAIHREGRRSKGPFIVVECAAAPPGVLEIELFGSERGAFAAAAAALPGAFESAEGGTLFFDEIGAIGLDLQAKLLRVLERRQVKRLGSGTYMPFDVRVIAATTRSLKSDVAANRFRSDLYYRLAVVEVMLPPLRERLADLPVLVDHVLDNLGIGHTAEVGVLRTPAFFADLASYGWPGNVRQLRSHLERCAALGEPLSPPSTDALPDGSVASPSLAIDVSLPLRQARQAWTSAFERRYLEALLARHRNNVSAAARAAGVDRIHLYRLLWKHGLRAHESDSCGGKR